VYLLSGESGSLAFLNAREFLSRAQNSAKASSYVDGCIRVPDIRTLMSGGLANEADLTVGRIFPRPAWSSLTAFKDNETLRQPASRKNEFSIRAFAVNDLDGLIAADLKAFRSVYRNTYQSYEQMYEDIVRKFQERYARLDPKWTDVLLDGQETIVGFLTMFPTNKPPEEFISWEDTTNDGTLDGVYDENGRYVYVASLTTVNAASSRNAQNMMLISAMSKVIRCRKDAYFVLRVPGMQKYVANWARENDVCVSDIDADTLQNLAVEYVNSKVEVDGKKVVVDPVLRNAEKIGCKILKVVPNAYHDAQSLNFGAVAMFEARPPAVLRLCGGLGRLAFSSALRSCSKSLKVSNWLCGEPDGQDTSENSKRSIASRVNQKLKENQLLVAAGLAVSSPVAVHYSGQTDEVLDILWSKESLGTVIALGALEIGWIGGAVVALSALGQSMQTYNPFKIRKKISELKNTDVNINLANESLFQRGFAINLASALGQSGLLGYYTIKELPQQSWAGPLSLIGADLAVLCGRAG